MIVIVDYGMGNLGSIRNMFRRLDIPAVVSRDAEEIAEGERLVLPGVGAFDAGISKLRAAGLEGLLTRRVVEERIPTLGICLGMQLMTHGSEEGTQDGLGWVDAMTRHLASGGGGGPGLKIPHMGWNYVEPVRDHALLAGLPADARFYFAHTYHVSCRVAADVLLRTWHGEIEFHSAFVHANIVGVQFHPEKSHRFGMCLLRSFAAWAPDVGGGRG